MRFFGVSALPSALGVAPLSSLWLVTDFALVVGLARGYAVLVNVAVASATRLVDTTSDTCTGFVCVSSGEARVF